MGSRGEYRSIHTVLVDDVDFQRMDPDAKVLWYTLKMQLGPSGIGPITAWYAVLGEQTGLPPDRLQVAAEELVEGDWLRVQENVFWLRNGLKYDPSITLTNEKHAKSVRKHLSGLPKLEIVNEFARYYDLDEPWAEIGHEYPHDTPTVPYAVQGRRKTEDGTGKTEDGSEGSLPSVENPSGEAVGETDREDDSEGETDNPWGPTVTACQEHVWLADDPPRGRSRGEEISVAKQIGERWNSPPDEVALACEGFGRLRDRGQFEGWIEPSEAACLLAMNRVPDEEQGIPVYVRCLHEMRKNGTDPPRSERGMSPIGEVRAG